MKSRITIDFDGEMNPVIRASVHNTDDVRDKLLKTFFQQLGGNSNWLSVEMNSIADSGERLYEIRPVKSENLPQVHALIKERL